MNSPFLTGLIGSLILVLGAAWPEGKKVKHPAKYVKNWLFVTGGILMFLYAIFGYQQGGPIFFVILQIFIAISNILMMLNTKDSIDVPILTVSGLGLVVWALTAFEGYNTVLFVLGLTGIGLGYAFQMGTLRRNLSLAIGSLLIAIFSYIANDQIFFWLNLFFAIFSTYYVIKQKWPKFFS